LIGRVLLVSALVLPGVEALPVSAPVNVRVGAVPPAPLIVLAEKEYVGEAKDKVKVSDPSVSELPVAV
jgi:ABC-type nitrate/sulfonate/bicarbonate transport system substrate-binding protein